MSGASLSCCPTACQPNFWTVYILSNTCFHPWNQSIKGFEGHHRKMRYERNSPCSTLSRVEPNATSVTAGFAPSQNFLQYPKPGRTECNNPELVSLDTLVPACSTLSRVEPNATAEQECTSQGFAVLQYP